MTMIRTLASLAASALFAAAVSAQCANFTSPGTLVGTGDDTVFATHYPLGFTFTMAGSAGTSSWTHFRVCTNGWMILTNGTTDSGTPANNNYGSAASLVGAAGNNPRFAPYWGDLNSSGAGNGVFFDNVTNAGVSTTITWRNVVDFGNAVQKTFRVELFASGQVKFVYAPGLNVNAGSNKLVGFSCSNGTTTPAASNFVPGPATAATGTMFETFAVGAADVGGRELTFVPAGAGWNSSVTCEVLSASNSSYGSGCYTISDSAYQLFANATAASPALTNQSVTFTPAGATYAMAWGGGSYVAPGGGAVNLTTTATDDGEVVVTPSLAFPAPQGPQATLRVNTNGIVSWGAAATTFPGTNNFTPTAAGFLNSNNAGIYAWHDFNEAESSPAASPRIVREEVVVGSDTVLFVTWPNVENYSSPAATNPTTMQYQINLTTGVVKVVWTNVDADATASTSTAYLVGYTPGGTSTDGGSLNLATALPLTVATSNLSAMTLAAAPAPVSTPSSGTTMTYTINNIPLACPSPAPVFNFGIVMLSLGQDLPGTDLGFLGAAGCSLHITSIDVQLPFIGSTASQTVNFAVPAGVVYGATFYAQSAALVCPFSLPNGQNAYGATVSNGVRSFVSFL